MLVKENPFDNKFDLVYQNINDLIIREASNENNCFIYLNSQIYNGFIISNKPKVKLILNVSFYKSNLDKKYLPRLEFRKTDKDGNVSKSKGEDVIIRLSDGDEARAFWKVIHFLQGFKDLVDLGDFHSKYQAISFDAYLGEFQSKQQVEKLKELLALTENINLSTDDIKKLLFSQRRNSVHWFYAFLKDLSNKENVNVFDSYRIKHGINENGEEAIWHHFLKRNEWLIGLNVDIKFIRDLLSKQKVGVENSKGKGSPEVDLLGISYFTTLIELKTSKTRVFKSEKTSSSRANTWDYSNEFIEAYSQALGQRTELNENKKIVDENNSIVDSEIHRVLDPKSVLIIGNRNIEFPHNRNATFNIKSDCFERFRRNIRNIDIITYDELFERAFYIVFTEKLPKDWFSIEPDIFKKEILKIK
jgi:hypothetical protein